MHLRSSIISALRPLLTAFAFGLVPALQAQPPSTAFRPALIDSFSAGYTYSANGDLSRGSVKTGEVSLARFDFSVSGRAPLREGLMFIPGIAYSHTTIDASVGVPLPKSVQELSLSLGLRGILSRQWAYGAFLRPGFYGDFKKLSDSFNAPLFLAAFYVPNPDLTWTFGVIANAFNDRPVLPIVGVRWKFAPDWQLDVGFPRTAVTYRVNSQLSFRTSLSAVGGNYRITENLGSPAPGVARLANTYLGLTEIRVGGGAIYAFTDGLELDLDAGVTTLRRFDYPDRNYRLRGANVGWLSLALRHRF